MTNARSIALVLTLAACHQVRPEAIEFAAPPPAPSASKPESITRADFGPRVYHLDPTPHDLASCVIDPLTPLPGTEARLEQRFPLQTVSAWEFEVERPGELHFHLGDLRDSNGLFEFAISVSPAEPVLVLVSLGTERVQQQPAFKSSIVCLRRDGRITTRTGELITSSAPEELDPYPIGWRQGSSSFGTVGAGSIAPLAVWSWNGTFTDRLAEARTFGGKYSLDLDLESRDLASKPLQDWSRPVLALTVCYTPDEH